MGEQWLPHIRALSPGMGGKLVCTRKTPGRKGTQGEGLTEPGQGGQCGGGDQKPDSERQKLGKREPCTLHSPSYVSSSLLRQDLWRAYYVTGTVLTSGDTGTKKPRSYPLRVL